MPLKVLTWQIPLFKHLLVELMDVHAYKWTYACVSDRINGRVRLFRMDVQTDVQLYNR